MTKEEELQAQVTELQGTLAERNEAFTKMETVANESKAKRDNLKGLIKSTFGVSEITEDSLKALKLNADEALRGDVENLSAQLADKDLEVEGVKAGYEKTISTMVLKDTLRGLGIDAIASNDLAFEQLTNVVLAEAERDGANFVFRNEDGTTRFNKAGKPLTVKERVTELQHSDLSYLFKPTAGAGVGQDNIGAKPKEGGTPLTKHIAQMYR